ncbi:hypothetical protein B0H11DRAFT_468622 [Mycena galericulata]|nr:hypothetical protein B0H11DRAFT_468622 [Mycena galericulata]
MLVQDVVLDSLPPLYPPTRPASVVLCVLISLLHTAVAPKELRLCHQVNYFPSASPSTSAAFVEVVDLVDLDDKERQDLDINSIQYSPGRPAPRVFNKNPVDCPRRWPLGLLAEGRKDTAQPIPATGLEHFSLPSPKSCTYLMTLPLEEPDDPTR